MGKFRFSSGINEGPGPSKSAERKGPSMPGAFVGVLSVIVCMLLVGYATSANFIIIFVLVWAIVVCPLSMHINGKVFWDPKVDWITGAMGSTLWCATTYFMMPEYYSDAAWYWSGLTLAVFTAIIVGKMARPPMPMWLMLVAGIVLSGIIIWMNNRAIHGHAVMAVNNMEEHALWMYIFPVVGVTTAVTLTAWVAQRLYRWFE